MKQRGRKREKGKRKEQRIYHPANPGEYICHLDGLLSSCGVYEVEESSKNRMSSKGAKSKDLKEKIITE